MPILGQGWELRVQRVGIQRRGTKKRTLGTYQVFIDGQAVRNLAGYMCESIGLGDNRQRGNGRRVEAGRYPLWTQYGRYVTTGYSNDMHTPGAAHMPGLLLLGTGNRVGILIHPAHPPSLYLSSVGCLNPSQQLSSDDVMNFWDSRARVIALIDSLRAHSPGAFEHPGVSTRLAGAFVVIDGEPMASIDTLMIDAEAAAVAAATPPSLPISRAAAKQCAQWLIDNYGRQLSAAVRGKPYGRKHLCAIVCQETAYKWLKWIGRFDNDTIIARCVFDASGDYPGTSRSAFPRNTAAFREEYGDAFTDMLIEEANLTRRMQDWDDKAWVYKGYGIFQYDLQHVKTNEAFFRQKRWYDFGECLRQCCSELDLKLASHNGDLWRAIKAYNGSGPRAEQYARNVRAFSDYCGEVTGN